MDLPLWQGNSLSFPKSLIHSDSHGSGIQKSWLNGMPDRVRDDNTGTTTEGLCPAVYSLYYTRNQSYIRHMERFSVESKIALLEKRVPAALELLKDCAVCPRDCRINRVRPAQGVVGQPASRRGTAHLGAARLRYHLSFRMQPEMHLLPELPYQPA